METISHNALSLIKEQEEQIFKLENRLKECENGYEGTLFLDRCKLHDAEENKRLQNQVNRLKKYDKERDIALHARLISETKADTVKKMQERLNKYFCHDPAFLGVEQRLITDVIDQIAKELLEGNNE